MSEPGQHVVDVFLPVQRVGALRDDPCHGLQTSFSGLQALQVWADFYLWELLLNDNPQLRAVFEVGTFEGGLARYLASQCDYRGLHFRTWDVNEPKHFEPDFHRLDVFAQPGKIVNLLHRWEPLVLFCDGGNKARELQTFGAALKQRESLVVVHDWEVEIHESDIPENLVAVYEHATDQLESLSRVFRLA